jgi:hypothetical protein
MQRRRLLKALAVITPVCLIMLWYFSPFRVFWSFDHIEQRARKRVTGTELQQWAMEIMAKHPVLPDDPASLHLSELPVPLPKPLLNVYHYPPYIFIFGDTNAPPGYVRLVWGGGMIGHCGFEIGPTNFVSLRSKDKWQDGVYFWRSP